MHSHWDVKQFQSPANSPIPETCADVLLHCKFGTYLFAAEIHLERVLMYDAETIQTVVLEIVYHHTEVPERNCADRPAD